MLVPGIRFPFWLSLTGRDCHVCTALSSPSLPLEIPTKARPIFSRILLLSFHFTSDREDAPRLLRPHVCRGLRGLDSRPLPSCPPQLSHYNFYHIPYLDFILKILFLAPALVRFRYASQQTRWGVGAGLPRGRLVFPVGSGETMSTLKSCVFLHNLCY